MRSSLFFLVGVFFLFTACAGTTSSSEFTPMAYGSFPPQPDNYPIQVYRSTRPSRDYIELGVIHVKGGGVQMAWETGEKFYRKAIELMQEEARKNGGDAVIDIRERSRGGLGVHLEGTLVKWVISVESSPYSKIPGTTVCTHTLKRHVYRQIYNLEKYISSLSEKAKKKLGKGVAGGGVPKEVPRIINTRVLEMPGETKDGSWTEVWTVERNGPGVEYRITLTPTSQGNARVAIVFPPTVAVESNSNN